MSASEADVGTLLSQRALAAPAGDVDSLLAQRASGGLAPTSSPTIAPSAAPLSKTSRFGQGLMDLPTGLGQIAEHVAETPLNAIRSVIRGGLNAAGASDAASLFDPVKTTDFDQIVHQREVDYQKARNAAQQSGIDWWRLGGWAANPLNYLGTGAAATVAGRIGSAALQGGAIGAAQPSTTPGSFWWDKIKGGSIGAIWGAGISSVIEGAVPLINMGINAARNVLGNEAASASPAADAIVNGALNEKGFDPASFDVNVLAGLKQEAEDALAHDVDPSPEMIASRARAESLPFPIRLLKGAASNNGMQFTNEQSLAAIKGVGEPITQRIVENNQAMIKNLDALGAKGAQDPVDLGTSIADKVQSFWDQVQSKKDALYTAVRNSQGQPATMDQFTAAQNIRDALDTPQASHAYDLLPENIKRTIGDLEDGKMPLTVGQMQALDKMWGAQARGADGSTAYAIGVARRELNNAPIADDVGEEARQAYQAARQAHAAQMSLIDPKLPNGMPNPNYQPLVDDVIYGGKPPETLFQKHFMGAAPSVVQKNMQFAGQIDPNLPEQIGRTYMGEIKRLALSGASDERGKVSEKVLSNFTQPVAAARMDAILPAPAAETFRNLAGAVEDANRVPVTSMAGKPNVSGTGAFVTNAGLSMLKQQGAPQVIKRLPIIKQLVQPFTEGMEAAKQATGVQEALNPGITLKSLLTATPSQAARRSLLTRGAIPAALAAESANEEKQ